METRTKQGGLMGPLNEAAFRLFLGHAPAWYKKIVVSIMVLNPVLLYGLAAATSMGTAKIVVGWLVVGEFIFMLAGALKCYPLLPGGLLVLETIILGLATPEKMYEEAHHNFPVILLLVFVVAGVHFLRDWLRVVFRWILIKISPKIGLAIGFCLMAAMKSAFLDALTVISVVITVIVGLHEVYHALRSEPDTDEEGELEQVRWFLCSLAMHSAVGTMLGGVMTKVGEPQNLLICHIMEQNLPPALAEHWTFAGFAIHMAPVTVPTLIAGLITCIVVERWKLFGYGEKMPMRLRKRLEEQREHDIKHRTSSDVWKLSVSTVCAVLLVGGLAFHVAEVGLLGLALIVLTTSFTGESEEEKIGEAFKMALPFTALLVVFFGIVGVITEQELFRPIVRWALTQPEDIQKIAFFGGSGTLSAISDNVFVATIFINEAAAAYKAGLISAEQFEVLAIAINTGTNIPSIATPNGQAAFLFLLTSPLAGLIRLGYGRMAYMALPYTITVTVTATLAVWYWL